MAEATTAHSHHYLSSPSSRDTHFIDTHLETKESRPFSLDRHRSFRNLDWRQRRYDQLYSEQFRNPPDPVKDMKGTRGEVWHEGRVKQTLAVRPLWLRACHCITCARFRFIEKDKEKRADIAFAVKRVGGCHLIQAYACDCRDSSCTGCLWDMPSVREDETEAGESHSEGYERQRTIPFEVDILDLLVLPRRSRRRARPISGLILGKGKTRANGSAVYSDTKSDGWDFVHEDLLTEVSSEWDHCSVASM